MNAWTRETGEYLFLLPVADVGIKGDDMLLFGNRNCQVVRCHVHLCKKVPRFREDMGIAIRGNAKAHVAPLKIELVFERNHCTKATSTINAPAPEIRYRPAPAPMPIAASAKIVAAVVSPTTLPRSRRITPAPRKPIPCTMLDAIRVPLESPTSRAISEESSVNSAAPMHTHILVRMPAGRRRMLRSTPITAPRKAAQSSR